MQKEIYGNIHSIETLGTLDGPGIRFVVFLQGCPMRCLYCHNPDTWSFDENKKITIDELLKQYEGVKEFLKNGGITLTGGEPLMQTDFATEFFKVAKSKNIHTAIDTSGIIFDKNNTQKIDELMKYTDLVLLDIKHIRNDEHKKLTGFSNKPVLDFAHYLAKKNIPVWIRHVLVENITLNELYLKELGQFLSGLNNLKALEVLPYHNMAISKYNDLNIEYKLKNAKPIGKIQVAEARQIIINAMKSYKDISL